MTFKREITLGHIAQMVVLLAAAIGAYWGMRTEIALTNARIDLAKTQLEAQISANTARYQTLDNQLGREITLIRQNLEEIKAELRDERDRNRGDPRR